MTCSGQSAIKCISNEISRLLRLSTTNAVWLKPKICKYHLKKRVHRSYLKHCHWLTKWFTCIMCHLATSYAGIRNCWLPAGVLFAVRRSTQWAQGDGLPLLLLWLEVLGHEITGASVNRGVRSQQDNLIPLTFQPGRTESAIPWILYIMTLWP